MNGGRLLHMTDGASQLVLRVYMWHLSHLWTELCSLITLFFLSFSFFFTYGEFYVPSCTGSIGPARFQLKKHDHFCWARARSRFGSSTAHDYLLKYELVTLQYHSNENGPGNSESGSCARTGSFESLSGICLSPMLTVTSLHCQIKTSSANSDKHLQQNMLVAFNLCAL